MTYHVTLGNEILAVLEECVYNDLAKLGNIAAETMFLARGSKINFYALLLYSLQPLLYSRR